MSCKPTKNSKDSLDNFPNRFIISVIENAIDLFAYPRTCIQICTQEICTDGAILSTTFNAICLALLDAGIRLRYIFAAVSVAKVGSNFIPNPNGLNLIGASSVYTFIFKPSITEVGGNLIANDCNGYFSLTDYNKALELARKDTLEIFDFFKQKVFDNYLPKCTLLK